MTRFKKCQLKRSLIFVSWGLKSSVLIVFLISVLGIVLLSIQMTLINSKMSSLSLEERKLLVRKRELEEKLTKGDSLSNFSNKAEELGFYKLDSNVVYLDAEKTMAKLP